MQRSSEKTVNLKFGKRQVKRKIYFFFLLKLSTEL